MQSGVYLVGNFQPKSKKNYFVKLKFFKLFCEKNPPGPTIKPIVEKLTFAINFDSVVTNQIVLLVVKSGPVGLRIDYEKYIIVQTGPDLTTFSNACVACHASHFIELPCQTSFLSFFLFFLLVCLRRLSTLLPPLCVILLFYH